MDLAAITANTTKEPNQDSGSDPNANLANRLVTFVPEGSSTVSSWQNENFEPADEKITGEMETNAEDNSDRY
jgi:hypothetical protein